MLADLEAARLQITTAPAGTPQEAATLTNAISARDLKEFAERASTPRWQTASPQQTTSRRGLYATLAVFLVAAGSLLVPEVRERLAGLLVSRAVNHVAVLPFDNIGNDPGNEAVAQGLMDSLTSELSNLSASQKSLWVVPASVVRSRKITDPSAALHELGATMVVKGSIQRDGQVVHLTVNLIDAKGLRQVGSAALEDRAGDIAALQDEAVARIARLMNINVTANLLHATGGSVAPAAYESYLKALGYMQRYDKPGNLDSAMSALESALKTDPRFALGYAQLGEAYRLKYQLEMNPKLIDEALANCQKAVQLDDRLASAYVTLGRIHERGGNHELAVQEFQHALDLDHRNAEALSGMAHSYETAGRIAEAETTYKKVVALRPDYWDGYDELGLFYDRQNKYAEAIEQVRHAVELTPDNAQAYSNLGAIYIDADDPKLHPEAEKALKKSVELGPSYPAYANLASLLYDEKRYAEAAAMNEKALQLNSENYMVWNWLRNDYIWLKDQTKADAAQERALQLVEREVKLKPQDGLVQAVLASIYAKKEVRDKARSRLQTALALSPDDPDVLEYAAATYEKLGDRSQAIEFAHKALKKGYSLARLQNDPDMQSLLSDPNFHPNGK
jgi:serine/threonine-protein kinase